jgi:hypothetical protein
MPESEAIPLWQWMEPSAAERERFDSRGGKPSPGTVPDKPHHPKNDERGGKPNPGTPKDKRKKGRGRKPGPKKK